VEEGPKDFVKMPKILIVEDSKFSVEWMVEMFNKHGY